MLGWVRSGVTRFWVNDHRESTVAKCWGLRIPGPVVWKRSHEPDRQRNVLALEIRRTSNVVTVQKFGKSKRKPDWTSLAGPCLRRTTEIDELGSDHANEKLYHLQDASTRCLLGSNRRRKWQTNIHNEGETTIAEHMASLHVASFDYVGRAGI